LGALILTDVAAQGSGSRVYGPLTLRYASYIARWSFEDFERVAKAYYGGGDDDFNFNSLYEEFCSKAGIDEPPDINADQKIIIIGSEVRDKLGSVALWLLEHSINIRVIELECYREDQRLLLQPNVIVPPPVNRFAEIGRIPTGDNPQPWHIDGKSWHLKKRCSAKNAELLLHIDEIVRETVGVEPPRWNQKLYIAYWVTNRICPRRVTTQPPQVARLLSEGLRAALDLFPKTWLVAWEKLCPELLLKIGQLVNTVHCERLTPAIAGGEWALQGRITIDRVTAENHSACFRQVNHHRLMPRGMPGSC
jgi:hypothetical protein